jgi:mannose-6-phosphate isomerase class I
MAGKYSKYGNYDLSPRIKVEGFDREVSEGYDALLAEIKKLMEQGKRIFTFDLYPGVDKASLLARLKKLNPDLLIDSEDCALTEEELSAFFASDMTDDRVFGILTHKELADCFVPKKLDAARRKAENADGAVFLVGVGAGLILRGDVSFYFNVSRWEIQLRYRAGMPNWHCGNADDPLLTKCKRGFFIEWRIADRYKRARFDDLDYMVDANLPECPKLLTGNAYRAALDQASRRPFRLKPYFDPGVWGGQWMRDAFGLPGDAPNYAWSFDGVPEENSLQFQFGETVAELPCMDLVLYRPHQLLGERVHGRFGAEFPIRFDLLDTMDGGNLSLQVHPLTEYIQENFGMHYTQDESYYILDAAEDEGPCVYLGLREGIDRHAMIADLKKAQQGNFRFPDEKYVNRIPVKKHDHVLIPAGTVHCAGKGAMVLEISATPYLFTFKLWDWGRVGLDGIPRPIHIDHGEQSIQWDRDTRWVTRNLIGQTKLCRKEDGLTVERTGLHAREFIETCRYTFRKPVVCQCGDSVHVLNLVDGGQITVTSPGDEFAPFDVHYAETFIVPASVKEYRLMPSGVSEGKTVMVIDASVR